MAHRIDPPVDAVQATRLDAPRDGAFGDAGCDQLRTQNNPVLKDREPRDLAIGVRDGAFRTHTV